MIRRYIISSQNGLDHAEYLVFWVGQIFGWEGPKNFWTNFLNYSHHQRCGKVWWQSAQRSPRLGCKREVRSTHLHQNISSPAGITARWPNNNKLCVSLLYIEPGTDGISIYSSFKSVFSGRLCGSRACAVRTKYGVLSTCGCRVSSTVAAY